MKAPASGRVWIARQIVKELANAENHAVLAHRVTEDKITAAWIGDARKLLAKARARAQAVLKDVDLKEAPQPELFEK